MISQAAIFRAPITRQAHQGIIFTSDFSPNGQLLATGSHDTSIMLWDTFTGKAIDTLPGRRKEARVRGDFSPFSLSFSPDGRTIASGSSDGMVKLWDVQTRQIIATLSKQSRVSSLCFGPEGTLVAAGMKDGTITVWDVDSKQPVVSFIGHEGNVRSIGFSGDGRILASGAEDRSVKLWDIPNGRKRATLLGHSGAIYGLDLSSEGETLATGSYDSTIRLWDIQTGTEKAILHGHTKGVSAVRFSSDGQSLASCSWDATVRLWDVTTGEQQAILRGPDGVGMWSVAISSNADWLASGNTEGTLNFWDCRAPKFHALLMGHENDVQNVRFNTDGTKLQSTDVKGNSVYWDLHTGNRLTDNVTDSFPLESPRSPDEKLLVKIVGRNIYLIDATTHMQNGQRWVDSLVSQPKLFAGDQAWAGTRESYRQLVDAKPNKPLAWIELMDVAWWDDWTNGRSLDSAMAIYPEARKALGEDFPELGVEVGHASWCLLTDQQEEYERVCRSVVEKHLNSDRPRTLFQVAKILAFGEQSILAPDQIVKIARKAIEADPTKDYFRAALTLSLVRAGQYEEALASCDENVALLAMTHAKMGNDNEARKWLQLAREEVQDNPLDPRSTWNPNQRLAWRLYLRETERILSRP